MIRTLSFASVLALALGACAANQGTLEPGDDELAGETGDGDAAKADAAHDTFNYLAVHKVGTVTNPLFGTAYNLQRANRSTTKCQDGAYHAQCGVHAMMWESMGLSQTQVDKIEAALEREVNDPSVGTQVIVKGSYKILVDFSGFEPTEIWVAQLSGGNDSGTFVQVFDRGIRCVTAPCPTFEEDKLNSTKTANIEGLDYGDASSSLQDKVYTATTTTGAIVVGDRETRSEVSFVDSMRSVNQVYLPVK
jgi:hypothetical protein